MNSINEKEKIKHCTRRIKKFRSRNPELQKNIENLSAKQNQLEIEKIQIEGKIQNVASRAWKSFKKTWDLKNKEELGRKKTN